MVSELLYHKYHMIQPMSNIYTLKIINSPSKVMLICKVMIVNIRFSLYNNLAYRSLIHGMIILWNNLY